MVPTYCHVLLVLGVASRGAAAPCDSSDGSACLDDETGEALVLLQTTLNRKPRNDIFECTRHFDVPSATDNVRKHAQEHVWKGVRDTVRRDSKTHDFYMAFMKATDTSVDAHIRDFLAKFNELTPHDAYARLSGVGAWGFLPSPFGVSVSIDPDSNTVAVTIDKARLGLPRAYYSNMMFAKQKAAYQTRIDATLANAGWGHKGSGTLITDLESDLADVKPSDPLHAALMTRDTLRNAAPDFKWDTFLDAAGIPDTATLIVDPFVVDMSVVLGQADAATLRSYAAFNFLSQVAQLRTTPRDTTAVSFANMYIGDTIDEVFLQYFTSEDTRRVNMIVDSVIRDRRARLTPSTGASTVSLSAMKLNALATLPPPPPTEESNGNTMLTWKDGTPDIYAIVEGLVASNWQGQLNTLRTPVPASTAYTYPSLTKVGLLAIVVSEKATDDDIRAVIDHEIDCVLGK